MHKKFTSSVNVLVGGCAEESCICASGGPNLTSEGSPVAKNLLGEYRQDLGTFIGHDRGMGY